MSLSRLRKGRGRRSPSARSRGCRPGTAATCLVVGSTTLKSQQCFLQKKDKTQVRDRRSEVAGEQSLCRGRLFFLCTEFFTTQDPKDAKNSGVQAEPTVPDCFLFLDGKRGELLPGRRRRAKNLHPSIHLEPLDSSRMESPASRLNPICVFSSPGVGKSSISRMIRKTASSRRARGCRAKSRY
jgi:hypothetical protein